MYTCYQVTLAAEDGHYAQADFQTEQAAEDYIKSNKANYGEGQELYITQTKRFNPIMLTADRLRAARSACAPAVIKIKGDKERRCERPPRKSSIDKIYAVVNQHVRINRALLIKKSGLSFYTIKRCLDVLIEQGRIESEFIGKSGPYSKYFYKSVKVRS